MFPSSYKGTHVGNFAKPVTTGPIDVCKMPAPPSPFAPVPYPNTATSWGTAPASKQAFNKDLHNKLQFLHSKITTMCGGDATLVHMALDVYVDTVIKLHYASKPISVGTVQNTKP
jgi:hypothetical protein